MCTSTLFSFKYSKLHLCDLQLYFFLPLSLSLFLFLFPFFLFSPFFSFFFFYFIFLDIGQILVNFKERLHCHIILFKYISGFTSYNMQILLSCYDICICCTLKCQNFIKHGSANVAQLFLKPRTRLNIYLKLTKLMRSSTEELTLFDVKEHRGIQNAT